MRIALLALAVTLLPASVSAQTIALLIGNERYQEAGNVRRADEVAEAGDALSDAGVQVVSRVNADLPAIQDALAEFGQMANQSERLIVALAGRFVNTPTETYLLPVESDAPPMARLPFEALSLSQVTAWLAAAPGDAILVLATDDDDDSFGLIAEGIGRIEPPQGVTLLVGEPRDAARFLERALTSTDDPYVPAARNADLAIVGYAPRRRVFLPPAEAEPTDVQTEAERDEDRRLRDRLLWTRIQETDTAQAYRDYLDAFPDGLFAAEARDRIAALERSPRERAETEEASLALSREARRAIQRDLSLLDYNTRGIDGIFGRGTRTAIARWQEAEDFPVTGYLTAEQISRLDAMAERRAAELEAEAERRRRQQLEQDRAYWDETGALGAEDGLRAYLERYPDGEYSEIARERLEVIEAEKRRNADIRDRRLWDEARDSDTIAAYQTYLDASPNGAFRDDASQRIAALRADARRESEINAAAREEDALNLSPSTRQLIESRLSGLGLKPGRVDGVFDENTRRAIRRYQASRNLEPTGYVTEAVVVRLLADTVQQIFR